MNIIKIPLCPNCGVPHIPEDIADRVRSGEQISVEIITQSQGIVKNVLEWGTGAINIDACRIEATGASLARNNAPGDNGWKNSSGGKNSAALREEQGLPQLGRWPANVIHDGSDEVLAEFAKYGESVGSGANLCVTGSTTVNSYGKYATRSTVGYTDNGTPARFFYSAKASQAERNENGENDHATVKPLALMEYLVTLVTPPNGIVLDPFLGSGTTGVAALRKKFRFVGIELVESHFNIATRRILDAERAAAGQPKQLIGQTADYSDTPLFATA